MTQISLKDLQLLNELTTSLYAAEGTAQFAERLVTSLPTLIGGDIYSYNEVDSRTLRSFSRWAPSSVSMIPDGLQILAHHADENPVVPHFKRTGDGRAVMVSDFLTQREFRERPLYQDFYKAYRIPYHLAIALKIKDSATITAIVHRGRREFSERDRLLLNLARPHIQQAHRQSELLESIQDQIRNQLIAMDALKLSLLAASPTGRIAWITETCKRVLHQWGLAPCRNRLPSLLLDWARADETQRNTTRQPASAPVPLVLTDPRGTLRITKLLAGPRWTFVVEATASATSPEPLKSLGLSRREAEILSWVAQGKSNPEIATILGISPHTVKKHLERIYTHLGVENRHAATLLATETIRQGRAGNGQI